MAKPKRNLTLNVLLAAFLLLWGFVLMCAEAAHAADLGANPPAARCRLA